MNIFGLCRRRRSEDEKWPRFSIKSENIVSLLIHTECLFRRLFPQAANRNLTIQTQVLVNRDITGNGHLSHFVQFYC